MAAKKKTFKVPSGIEIPSEFGDLNDRACGIVAAAALEDVLELLIRRRFVENAAEPLFAGRYGPLASFAAKIDTGRALGVVSATECEDLHLYRKIRNAFAHEHRKLTFDDQPVVDHVRSLKYCGAVLLKQQLPSRRNFELGVLMLTGFLEAHFAKVKHLDAQSDMFEKFSRGQDSPTMRRKAIRAVLE